MCGIGTIFSGFHCSLFFIICFCYMLNRFILKVILLNENVLLSFVVVIKTLKVQGRPPGWRERSPASGGTCGRRRGRFLGTCAPGTSGEAAGLSRPDASKSRTAGKARLCRTCAVLKRGMQTRLMAAPASWLRLTLTTLPSGVLWSPFTGWPPRSRTPNRLRRRTTHQRLSP